MKAWIIVLAACVLSIPIGLAFLAAFPFALAYGASVDLFDREKLALRRENARLTKRNNELCEALAERAPVASWCEGPAERMTRMFGAHWSEQ